MFEYSIFANFPDHGVDSILVFSRRKLLCVYRIYRNDTLQIAQDLESKKIEIICPDQAKDYLKLEGEEKSFQSAKNLLKKYGPNEQQLLVSLAYTTAKENLYAANELLESSDSHGDLLNERLSNKEKAEAIFLVVEQVYLSFNQGKE